MEAGYRKPRELIDRGYLSVLDCFSSGRVSAKAQNLLIPYLFDK
jgi:hypothetical protein